MARLTGKAGSRAHDGHPAAQAAQPRDRLRAALAGWLSPAALAGRPPLWRESRMVRELSALRLGSIVPKDEMPDGRGRPVLLIPGYLASDRSLGPMARWLRDAGYRTAKAGMRLNADCVDRALVSLEARLEQHVAACGEPALIIGQSRGGLFGRLLAGRRPELVSRLITLGAPLMNPFGIHPLVLLNIGVVGALGSLGVPGLLSTRCWRSGTCCGATWDEIGKPLRAPFLSIYSRSDGIVDWRACLDPAARHAAVDSSHLGMAFIPAVYRLIAEELRDG
jgi:triacylglycerol lipase